MSEAMDQMIVRDPSATRIIRRAMVDNQIRTFDVTDQPLLDRFYGVPREAFLPEGLAPLAYSDAVLTVAGRDGLKRILLMPMVLARLLQGAAVQPSDRVLVVGGGTGYSTALLAGMCAEVTALERDIGFTAGAMAAFKALDLPQASAVTGSLAEGYAAKGPFDVIVVEGAVEDHLDPLLAQLADRGRFVTIRKMAFDGVRRSGRAMLYERFGREIGSRPLFDSSAAVLDEFAKAVSFAF
ncbi:protein-L-isoaspartate O-methyltransferase [Lichenihabitans sp. Uapishka_5]|uniref:protein-L-isoaspartate O-methyltransferase family protein n=1 Tax=Lichenihabitans sp. Uapishka_5 TaxID=3037302 RepID=UPI0029E7F19C|nr:protein-L-isoaspartate O-methyltransferase [Lichenihabitans sp. Uapishka_5]MDX7949934.1 protein-L-isoaspartate O-methyltransferase [Lichenihabitans sp. Uapishka_5]